jgi:hypothetical protein
MKAVWLTVTDVQFENSGPLLPEARCRRGRLRSGGPDNNDDDFNHNYYYDNDYDDGNDHNDVDDLIESRKSSHGRCPHRSGKVFQLLPVFHAVGRHQPPRQLLRAAQQASGLHATYTIQSGVSSEMNYLGPIFFSDFRQKYGERKTFDDFDSNFSILGRKNINKNALFSPKICSDHNIDPRLW